MAVPSSGELKLREDINQEINGNDSDTNVSLGTLSNDASFTEPDNMSEFYGYTSCGTPTFGSASASASPDGHINAQGILYTNGPSCNVTGCGLYIGTSSNIANATKYTTATSWGIYSWKYFNKTGYTNGSTYYVWIWAYNGANEGVSNMYTVTVPAAYVPISAANFSLQGDSQIYHYANGCRGSIINSLIQTHTNNSSSTVYYDYYQKYTTTYNADSYNQTCPNQCRKDYINEHLTGNQVVVKTKGFEWNYNGAGGAYLSCFLCADPANSPQYLNNILVITKSGYTTRQYSMNLLYWRYN